MSAPIEQETSGASMPPQAEPKKKGPSPVAMVIVAAVIVAAVVFFMRGRGKITTDDAQVYGHTHSVSPEVAARVVEVLVDDNEMVKKGQKLVVLDDSTYQAKFEDAKAALEQAQATRDTAVEALAIVRVDTVENLAQAQAALVASKANRQAAQHGVEIAQHAVDAAQANVVSAVANLQLRQFQKEQIAKGVSESPGAASLERVKQSETDFDGATASKAAADAALSQTENELAVKREDLKAAEQSVLSAAAAVKKAQTGPEQIKAAEAKLAAAEAAVKVSQAQLDLAELNLSYCSVVAPSDGQIAKKSVEVGNYVMPGTPLLTVVDIATVWVLANYKETQLKEIRPGQRVEMTSDIYPGWTFTGKVESLDSGTGAAYGLFPPQNATGNYVKIVQRVPVKVVIPEDQRDPKRPFKLGMNIVAITHTSGDE